MIVFVSLFCLQSNAQSFGLKAGLNFSNMLNKNDDVTYSDDYKMNPGFHFGATVDVPLINFLSFESGLFCTTKGMKYELEVMEANITATTNLFYLDVPLTLKASYGLGGIKVFGNVGPYFDFGLSGKIKATAEYQGEKTTEKEDVKWGNDEEEDNLKRLDMGLTFGGGVEINSIMIGISYDLGLSNISPSQDNGTKIKNRVLKFSVGYRFGK